MKYLKLFIVSFFAVIFLFILKENSLAQSTACGSCPDGSGRACTSWSPPYQVCTNGDWYCNSCAPCSTPPPACPGGQQPGDYCNDFCTACGVSTIYKLNSACQCVATGETYSQSLCSTCGSWCQSACTTPVPPTATPKPPTSTPVPTIYIPPPPSCPDAVCNNNETCNSCPQDCGVCPAQPTATPKNTPTSTPVPACGDSCAGNPNKCQNLSGCNYCNPTSKKCEAPPACGDSCAGNPNICQNLNGCNYCNPTSQKCEAQPTATPTPVPACNTRCDDKPQSFCAGGSNRTDGCTVCATDPNNPGQKTCQPPPTATPTPTATSTPTPTPLPFDESMCKCNGLDFGRIALGTPVKVTAYGIVEGVNTNYAKIPSFTFVFYQGNGTVVKQLKKDTVPATVIENTAQKVRYQSDWTLDLPTSLDTSQTYRIQAKPECSRKTAAIYNAYPTTAVLAAESEKTVSLWGRIVNFFANLFGGGTQNNVASNNSLPTPTPTLTDAQRKQLQLKTFTPASGVSTDNCSFIKFNF